MWMEGGQSKWLEVYRRKSDWRGNPLSCSGTYLCTNNGINLQLSRSMARDELFLRHKYLQLLLNFIEVSVNKPFGIDGEARG